MPIQHENADTGTEADQFRDVIGKYNTAIVADTLDAEGTTTLIYVCGEGDLPFVKYRLTLEAIGLVDGDEFDQLQDAATAAAKEPAEDA